MFRSSSILRELVQSLAKVIFILKHSVRLRHCVSCGNMAACREVACVLFVVQTDTESHAISRHSATSAQSIQRRNFTKCFNRSVTLARLCTSSLRMV